MLCHIILAILRLILASVRHARRVVASWAVTLESLPARIRALRTEGAPPPPSLGTVMAWMVDATAIGLILSRVI